MAREPLTAEDLVGEGGSGSCVHARLELIVTAVNDWWTVPATDIVTRRDVSFKQFLELRAGRTLTVQMCERALRLWLDRRS